MATHVLEKKNGVKQHYKKAMFIKNTLQPK